MTDEMTDGQDFVAEIAERAVTGVIVRQDGERFRARILDPWAGDGKGGTSDHFHADAPPVGPITVWATAASDGDDLNLFATVMLASLTGELRPLTGDAVVVGAGDTDLTEEQLEVILGAEYADLDLPEEES